MARITPQEREQMERRIAEINQQLRIASDENLPGAAHRAAPADAPRSYVSGLLHRLDALELQERLDLIGLDLVEHDRQAGELH